MKNLKKIGQIKLKKNQPYQDNQQNQEKVLNNLLTNKSIVKTDKFLTQQHRRIKRRNKKVAKGKRVCLYIKKARCQIDWDEMVIRKGKDEVEVEEKEEIPLFIIACWFATAQPGARKRKKKRK